MKSLYIAFTFDAGFGFIDLHALRLSIILLHCLMQLFKWSVCFEANDTSFLKCCLELFKPFSLNSLRNNAFWSGEMKKDLKRVGIYRGMDLTLVLIKDEL